MPDFDEKTEAPTPQRRQEARERGQIARSTDLTAAGALLGAMIVLNLFGPGMINDMMTILRNALSYSGSDSVLPSSIISLTYVNSYAAIRLIAPICIVLMFLAILITFGQVGFLFTFHPLEPKLEKLNPISGFSKLFNMQSLVKLFTNVMKISVIGFVAYLVIKNRMSEIVSITALDHWQIAHVAANLMYSLGIRLGLVLLIIAIFDFFYTRHSHEKSLKMTKQEIKDELRRMEGDPLVRERRKRVARQLAQQRMQQAVPKSDVVITNPTELAIALKYDVKTMNAPKVVAKGAGFVAAKIRKIAIENGIPIVERKPLAQAIYKTVEIGQEIPPSFYKAVAEILAYVYELTGKKAPITQSENRRPIPTTR